MGRKRPERTERRQRARAARQLVRDREKLATLSPGGTREHPIEVDAASVVEVRVNALPCPQCEGSYRLIEHRSAGAGIRVVSVTCQRCHVSREIWFRLGTAEPN